MIEVNKSAAPIRGRAGNDAIKNDRAVRSFVAGGDIQRVQTVSLDARFLGAGDDVECAAGQIDCRCAADPNFADECAAIWSDIGRRWDRDTQGWIGEVGAP